MSDKKKQQDDSKKKPKPSTLGWGMARGAAKHLTDRKKKMDLAIKEAEG
jgi:hypothetical protein